MGKTAPVESDTTLLKGNPAIFCRKNLLVVAAEWKPIWGAVIFVHRIAWEKSGTGEINQ